MGLDSAQPIIASHVTCSLQYNYALQTCLNCSVIPNECSGSTVAGVKCQPGVGELPGHSMFMNYTNCILIYMAILP